MQFKPRQLEDLYQLIQEERAQTHVRDAAEQVALAVLIDIDTKLYARLNRLGTVGNVVSIPFTPAQLAALAWLYEKWGQHTPGSLNGLLLGNHQQLQ